MPEPTMRNITIDESVYQDAVTLSAQEWMSKYKINEGYRGQVEHFSVAKDGSHAFSVKGADGVEVNPKLVEGWTRMFLLGNQLASEEKGLGGSPPADSFELGVPTLQTKNGSFDDRCVTIHSPPTGKTRVVVTEKYIESTLGNAAYFNAGHLPDQRMDPFQFAVIAGAEEGLHGAFYRTPGYRQKLDDQVFNLPDPSTIRFGKKYDMYNQYSTDPGEMVIRDDLQRIAGKLGFEYDHPRWEKFTTDHNLRAGGVTQIVARQAPDEKVTPANAEEKGGPAVIANNPDEAHPKVITAGLVKPAQAEQVTPGGIIIQDPQATGAGHVQVSITTPPEGAALITDPAILQAKAVVNPKLFSSTPITEQNANPVVWEIPIDEQNAARGASGGRLQSLGVGQGALFTLQVGASLLDRNNKTSTTEEALSAGQLGTTATQTVVDVADKIRPPVTPAAPGAFRVGLQGAGNLFGLGLSGKGLYDSIEARDATGIVMNSGGLTSASLGTAGTIAQIVSRGAMASRLFMGANVIGAPLAVAGVYIQANDYARQMGELGETISSMDNQRTRFYQSDITKGFRDIGLPLKPELREYKNLGVLGATDGLSAVSQDPEQMKAVLRPKVQVMGNAYQERQAALDSMTSVAHASTVGRVFNAITPGDWNKTDDERLSRADAQISSGTQALNALGEMSGSIARGGPNRAIRGYGERFLAYQQRLQPLEKDYGDQVAQLNQLPDVYTTVRDRKTIAQMEGKGALDIAAGDHPGDKAVAAQRDYFENIVAGPLTRDQDKLGQASVNLQNLQAQLKYESSWAAMNPISGGRGRGRLSPQQVQITNAHIAEGKAKMGPLQEQVTHAQDEIRALQQTVAADQGDVQNYVMSELIRKNVLAEREKVEAMTPEQKEAYFRKNGEFIAKAGLQDRQDLAWVGLSTSHQEYLAKAMEFAPGALAADAQKEAIQNNAALARLEQSNEALAQSVKSRASLGAVGDPPILDATGKPMVDGQNKPVTFASLSATMDGALADENKKLEALRADPGATLNPDQQARITIEEAAISQTKLDRATLENQKLAYQSLAYDRLERNQQAAQEMLGEKFEAFKSIEQTFPGMAGALNTVRDMFGGSAPAENPGSTTITDPAGQRKASTVTRS